MGLFFSHDAQTGGFQSENVRWNSEPDVLLNESARKLSLLDEKYLSPVQETGPSPLNLDQSTPPMRVETQSEEKYFDPVITHE